MSYTMIDLFSGVGGLSLGFEMAGFKAVIANEYDASIAESYIKNRPHVKMIVNDIISTKSIYFNKQNKETSHQLNPQFKNKGIPTHWGNKNDISRSISAGILR